MSIMTKQELEMIDKLSKETKRLIEQEKYSFFDLACYIDNIIDNTSQSHTNSYFSFLYNLKEIYLILSAEN